MNQNPSRLAGVYSGFAMAAASVLSACGGGADSAAPATLASRGRCA